MNTRRKQLIGGIVAAAALASIAVGVVHFRSTSGRMPPASASSETVLRVYLKAAKDHDCAVTEALTDSDGSDQRSMAWCGGRISSLLSDHPDLLSYRHIGAVSRESGSATGGTVEECIPVDITETNMSGAKPGPLPGWQFCFRQTPSGWRLTDEGYG